MSNREIKRLRKDMARWPKEIKRLRKDIREGKKEMTFLIELLHEDQLHEYNDWLLQNVSETRKLERPRI